MDATIFHCVRWKIELAEDAAYVRLDRLRTDVKRLTDSTVCPAFREEGEDLDLARRQLCERVVLGWRRDEIGTQLTALGIAPLLEL
jgi:hypothetical protein